MKQEATNPSSVAAEAGSQDEAITRRDFLNKLSIALTAVGGAIVGLPVIGFLLAPLIEKSPEDWRTIGPVSQFKVGETVQVSFEDPSPLPWAGIASRTSAYLRRDTETSFTAYSVNCTHLGCPVSWLSGADLFMCPCHGGVYYKDGTVAAGPPPKPLINYQVRVRNGNVEILAGQGVV